MPNVNNQKKLLVDERSIFLSEKHTTPFLLLLLPFLQSVVFGRLAAVQLLLKKPSPAPAPFLSLGNFENFINMLMT